MNKRTFLYARVSTDMQATGLESQIRALKLYCEQNGITDYEIFADEGISGAKESRPSLNRMMESVEAGGASQIVVFSFSRFARSTTHLLKALQKFKEKGVQFCSLTERVDTNSAMGVAIFTILGAISQLERELICERVKAGLANARAKGKHIGRKKLRDSDLIRKLRRAGLTYRAIAVIARTSHGAVHAEIVSMKRDEARDLLKREQEEIENKKRAEEQSVVFPAIAMNSIATPSPDGQKDAESYLGDVVG